MKDNKIYTHDVAVSIVEMFECVLDKNNILVPPPEDDEREADSDAKLYGSTYSDLLDNAEAVLINLLDRHNAGTVVITGEFSGVI